MILFLAIITVCSILITFSIISIANTLWNILQELKNNNYGLRKEM